MTCVDTIKEKIYTIKKENRANETLVTSVMDDILDTILNIQKILEIQYNNMDALTDCLITITPTINFEEYNSLKSSLKNLNKGLTNTYIHIRKSPTIYSGVRSYLENYRNSLDSLKEATNDLEVISKLKNDQEYKDLINQLKAL